MDFLTALTSDLNHSAMLLPSISTCTVKINFGERETIPIPFLLIHGKDITLKLSLGIAKNIRRCALLNKRAVPTIGQIFLMSEALNKWAGESYIYI